MRGVRCVRPAPTNVRGVVLEGQPRNVRGLHASMYLAGQQGCSGEERRRVGRELWEIWHLGASL